MRLNSIHLKQNRGGNPFHSADDVKVGRRAAMSGFATSDGGSARRAAGGQPTRKQRSRAASQPPPRCRLRIKRDVSTCDSDPCPRPFRDRALSARDERAGRAVRRIQGRPSHPEAAVVGVSRLWLRRESATEALAQQVMHAVTGPCTSPVAVPDWCSERP